MQEYFFLFGLAFTWIVFASIQDLRTTEVSNWLNYSLIVFALGYRAFYSSFQGDWMFFIYGFLGLLIFVAFGYLFYYARIFGGGDTKLLMGLGVVLPFESLKGYLILGGGFILLLFLSGLVWTIVYSIRIVNRKNKQFWAEFKRQFAKSRAWLSSVLLFSLFLEITNYKHPLFFNGFMFSSFLILSLLYVYARALDSGCMNVLKNYKKLQEGDKLIGPLRLKGKIIDVSVHGLSKEDIIFLQRHKKSVWVKEGVPFVPSFIIALVLFFILWIRGFFSLI